MSARQPPLFVQDALQVEVNGKFENNKNKQR
jgi:hypothetical protein